MIFDYPMRLTGPLDSGSLMNQMGMPGGSGMRLMGAYDTGSLMRQYGPQNALGYGMGGMGMGMGGMMGNPMAGNMGMAAVGAVAAAALLQEEQNRQNQQNQQQNQWNNQPGMNQPQQNQWNNQSGMGQPQQNQWNNQSGMGQPQQNQWNNQSGMGQSQSSYSTPTAMNQQVNPNAPQTMPLGGMQSSGNQPQAWNAPSANQPQQNQWNSQPQNQQQNQWGNQPQNQQQNQWGNQPQNQQQNQWGSQPQNQQQNQWGSQPQNQQQNQWGSQPQNQQQNQRSNPPMNQQQSQRSNPPMNQQQNQWNSQPQSMQQNQQPAAPKTTAPPLPAGGRVMQRGQKTSLGANLRRLKIGLRWDVRDQRCDLDASAFLLTSNEKVPGDEWFVFYGQEQSPDSSTRYRGYDIGGSDLTIDLTKVRPDIEKIALAVTIYEAIAQRLNFSMVNSVKAALIDEDTNQVLAALDLTDCSAVVTALVVGEIYRYKGEWKFNAVGSGVSRDLAGFCSMYGVNLE